MNFIHELNRIYLKDDNDKIIAEVTFPSINDNTVAIEHTFVDESLRGQGIASKLLEAAASQIRSEKKFAKPTCSYAIRWFNEHKEYQDIRVD